MNTRSDSSLHSVCHYYSVISEEVEDLRQSAFTEVLLNLHIYKSHVPRKWKVESGVFTNIFQKCMYLSMFK